MALKEKLGESRYLYSCTLVCSDAGRFGYTARVIPRGDEILKAIPGLMTWAG